MDQLNELTHLIEYIQNELCVSLFINDSTGFSQQNSELFAIVARHSIHNTSYCMKLKTNTDLWHKCVKLKDRIYKKLVEKDELYFGVCHCGVGEYICPIKNGDTLYGFVSVSGFKADDDASIPRMTAAAMEYGFDPDELQKLYEDSFLEIPTNTKQIIKRTQLLCTRLGIIAKAQDTLPSFKLGDAQHSILIKAQEYIGQKYSEDITIEEIARFCNCSLSYLQHLYKANTRRSIKRTICELRLYHAKQLLLKTSLPIYAIAPMVGFNDANYFSNAFGKFIGMSPLVYRKLIDERRVTHEV